MTEQEIMDRAWLMVLYKMAGFALPPKTFVSTIGVRVCVTLTVDGQEYDCYFDGHGIIEKVD
jgi:hypothetical protein